MTYKYTNQEIFDKVVARLYDGTGRARDPKDIQCVYKMVKAERRCAAGILVPDDHPLLSAQKWCQENPSSWRNVCEQWPDLYDIGDSRFITKMQTIHDWKLHWQGKKFVGLHALASVAKEYNLVLNLPKAA